MSQHKGSSNEPCFPRAQAAHPASINDLHRVRSLTEESFTQDSPDDSLSYPPPDSYDSHVTSGTTTALPEPDTGFAWIYLAAAFSIELLAWGMHFSSGVLLEYWHSTLFPTSPSVIVTSAATLQGGVLYASAIVLRPLYKRYPQHRAKFQYAGLALSVLGILLSGFVTAPWQLLITSGLLYSIGAGTVYLPAVVLVFEWFAQKRGLAAAIVYSGTGVGGAVIPIIMRALLNRFSYKAACTSLALGYGLLGVISIYFIRERIPVQKNFRDFSQRDGSRRQPAYSFLRKRSFYAFTATVLVTSAANFMPSLEIPTYAAALGFSNTSGTLLLSIMNASSVIGLILFGSLSDRLPLKLVLPLSCIASSLSCFLLWGFGTQLGILVVFSICWGLSGLSFTALWTRMIVVISGDDASLPPMIFAVFGLVRGLGAVMSGPILSVLKSGHVDDIRNGVYGIAGYGPLVFYTGGILALGAVTGVSYGS